MADIIVTATGLKIQLFGGADVKVDGRSIRINEKYTWNGVMLQDVPNAGMLIGYTSTAWTLGVDIMAKLVVKLIKGMEEREKKVVTPRLDPEMGVRRARLLDINATYVNIAVGSMPLAGDRGPWRRRRGYFEDCWKVGFGDLGEGVVFE
ncbi:uncharacterized protein DFL_005401 [Arthrobotrys flagrans]|nr:hypothetical protein DFL_005401 [Arthrobotrys flagrans]